MNKRVVGAVIAVVAFVVALVMVANWVSGAEQRALAAVDPVDVVMVTAPIPEGGTAVVDVNITVTEVPGKAVAPGVVTDPATLDGLVAAVDLVVGEQVFASRFVNPAEEEAPVEIPAGYAQMQMPMSAERAIGTLLEAGDTVGVVVSYTDPERTTTTVLHKVLVSKLHVTDGSDRTSAAASEEAGMEVAVVPTNYAVTLAAMPHDLEKIIWGAEHATVWLTLENEDTDVSGSKPVTIGVIDPTLEGYTPPPAPPAGEE